MDSPIAEKGSVRAIKSPESIKEISDSLRVIQEQRGDPIIPENSIFRMLAESAKNPQEGNELKLKPAELDRITIQTIQFLTHNGIAVPFTFIDDESMPVVDRQYLFERAEELEVQNKVPVVDKEAVFNKANALQEDQIGDMVDFIPNPYTYIKIGYVNFDLPADQSASLLRDASVDVRLSVEAHAVASIIANGGEVIDGTPLEDLIRQAQEIKRKKESYQGEKPRIKLSAEELAESLHQDWHELIVNQDLFRKLASSENLEGAEQALLTRIVLTDRKTPSNNGLPDIARIRERVIELYEEQLQMSREFSSELAGFSHDYRHMFEPDPSTLQGLIDAQEKPSGMDKNEHLIQLVTIINQIVRQERPRLTPDEIGKLSAAERARIAVERLAEWKTWGEIDQSLLADRMSNESPEDRREYLLFREHERQLIIQETCDDIHGDFERQGFTDERNGIEQLLTHYWQLLRTRSEVRTPADMHISDLLDAVGIENINARPELSEVVDTLYNVYLADRNGDRLNESNPNKLKDQSYMQALDIVLPNPALTVDELPELLQEKLNLPDWKIRIIIASLISDGIIVKVEKEPIEIIKPKEPAEIKKRPKTDGKETQ